MEELYNALDVIKKYIGTEVYEVCLVSKGKEINGCLGDYCENCGNLWKTKLSYDNLNKIGKSVFFTKDEARKTLKRAKIKIYELNENTP